LCQNMLTVPSQNQGRKRRGRKTPGANRNPSSAVLRYVGPLRVPQEELVATDLIADFPISSSGGVINFTVADVPTSSPDWASLQALYAEYRVLAMKVEFNPIVLGATVGSNAYNVLYIVWDAADAAVALTSYTAAANYPVKTCRALNARQTLSHKMSGTVEASFGLTSATVFDYAFKCYADTLTAAALYGRMTVTWKVQCRGRQ